MKSLQRFLLVSPLIAAVTLFAADALTHRVEQKNREFLTKEITLKPGEKIEFCNSDDVTHNVFSKSAANPFNLKTQKPGESTVIEFKQEGVTEVRCAIHPAMKLKITVKQ
jgi:plastocyanin